MSIDLFNTRTMIEAVEQMKRPTSFFRDTFFPTYRTFVTEQVDVDIVKARRRVAPFVKPGLPGKVVNRDGYSTKFYKAPMISEKMETMYTMAFEIAQVEIEKMLFSSKYDNNNNNSLTS